MYYIPGGKFQSWAPQSGRQGHRRDERTVSWSGNALMKMQFLKLFLGFVKVHRNGCVFVILSWGSLVSTTFQKVWQKKLAAHPSWLSKKRWLSAKWGVWCVDLDIWPSAKLMGKAKLSQVQSGNLRDTRVSKSKSQARVASLHTFERTGQIFQVGQVGDSESEIGASTAYHSITQLQCCNAFNAWASSSMIYTLSTHSLVINGIFNLLHF